STECTNEVAARSILLKWEQTEEKIKAGVLTAAEVDTSKHQRTPIKEHFAAFDVHLSAKGASAIHRTYTKRYLDRIADECPFGMLGDLKRETFERWLVKLASEDTGAKARNHYRGALVSFCNWCVTTNRLTVNPFRGIPKANEKADRRRLRRSMTEDELSAL